jgi:hypothetical protein
MEPIGLIISAEADPEGDLIAGKLVHEGQARILAQRRMPSRVRRFRPFRAGKRRAK